MDVFKLMCAFTRRWAEQACALLKVDLETRHFYIGVARNGRTDEECEALVRQMKVDITLVTNDPIRTSYKIYATEDDLNVAVLKCEEWLRNEYAKAGLQL